MRVAWVGRPLPTTKVDNHKLVTLPSLRSPVQSPYADASAFHF